MECPRCGAGEQDGGKFCTRCGVPLPKICRTCGTLNSSDARFCGECGGVLAAGTLQSPSPVSSDGLPRSAAERRQLTVLFCDLVGSTVLSSRLHPEDLHQVIGAYHRCCATVITQHDGFVANYMGDGVLAYFGYPHAHEDDAEAAVRAALGLVDSIGAIETSGCGKLQARVGVASGLVIIGALGGEGRSGSHEVVGEIPNLAARLQSIAAPGQVLISAGTWKLTRGFFRCSDMRTVSLKGFDEPVQTWHVAGETQAASRFEARRAAKLTPLVGREKEQELLMRHWRQAVSGDGSAVLLTGDPGIGKSRLTAAMEDMVRSDRHLRVHCFCSPHHSNSALHPVIEHLERAARFERGDTPAEKLVKIESLLVHPAKDAQLSLALLADLLSVPAEAFSGLLTRNPQKRREQTLEMLLAQVEDLASDGPVLMVFEDVHWIDPTTLEFLAALLERLPRLRMLLIITARPEFVAPWPDHAHVTTISLTRLGPNEVAAVTAYVAGGRNLPEEVMAQILARTDGVPLFVEELTLTVLESGLMRERDGRFVLDGPLPPLTIPTTLQASMMARLDRLAPVKEVAQIGAALGRSFSYQMLAAVAGQEEPALRAALSRLVNAEMLFQRGLPPEAIYVFKHALVQDTAYDSLLRSRRLVLHLQIVKGIEKQFPEIVETQPEQLAHHCMQAQLYEKAAGYWLKAGQRSVARSANLEAIKHLQKGIEAVAQVPPGAALQKLELSLQVTLGHASIAVNGYAHEVTRAAYARAHKLVARVGDSHEHYAVLFGLYVGHLMNGPLDLAADPVAQLFDLAMRGGDSGYICLAHRVVGILALYRGDLTKSRLHLERAIELYNASSHRELAFRFGSDMGLSAKAYLVVVQWLLGQPDQARSLADKTIAESRQLAHANTLGQVLALVSHAYCESKDYQTLSLIGEEGTRFCEARSMAFFTPWLRILTIWAKANLAKPVSDADELRRALDSYAATNTTLYRGYFRGLLAQLLLQSGEVAAAAREAERALKDVAATGEHWWEPELLRIRGECLLATGGSASTGAPACFRKAVEEARRMKALMLELRAATSLSRMLVTEGKSAASRDILVPILARFEKDSQNSDLQAAREVLEQSAPTS